MSVNVDLAKVVFTRLDTPTAWVSTPVADSKPQWPNGFKDTEEATPKTTIPGSRDELTTARNPLTFTGGFKDPTATTVDHTATKTFSIVHNHVVLATFTVVGTIASPPRGVPASPGILSSEGILLITVITALLAFFFSYGYVVARSYGQKMANAHHDQNAEQPSEENNADLADNHAENEVGLNEMNAHSYIPPTAETPNRGRQLNRLKQH
ncbi:hypothetical protein TWF696_003762 [Orbilia brochopaga]|uniref:Transmembrane protein n=1 Tax=Orbilia brochopaga TaxID=3140254 RepID=A0AAV9V484_9PEZI